MISPKPQVLIFDRRPTHPGYVLIHSIPKGTQAQTTLVRSLHDGQIYARKYYRRSPLGNEQKFSSLPTTIAPALVECINSGTKRGFEGEDVFIYEYCNGGDLQDMNLLNGKGDVSRSEYWEVMGQIVGILAWCLDGWRYNDGAPTVEGDWDPIIHTDEVATNYFISWKGDKREDDQIPRIQLGDWSGAWRWLDLMKSAPASSKEAMYRTQLRQGIKIWREQVLSVYPDIQDGKETPAELCDRLYTQATDWKEEEGEFSSKSVMQWFAEQFIPIANERAKSDRIADGLAAGWKKPSPLRGYQVFRADAEDIEGPYEYMDEDRLPDIVSRTSALN